MRSFFCLTRSFEDGQCTQIGCGSSKQDVCVRACVCVCACGVWRVKWCVLMCVCVCVRVKWCVRVCVPQNYISMVCAQRGRELWAQSAKKCLTTGVGRANNLLVFKRFVIWKHWHSEFLSWWQHERYRSSSSSVSQNHVSKNFTFFQSFSMFE